MTASHSHADTTHTYAAPSRTYKPARKMTWTARATERVNTWKPAARGTHVVQRGDTLSSLAGRYHVDGGWKALWAANKSTVEDPNWIYTGQVLRLPR